MFDEIGDFFSDIDGSQLMVTGIMWLVCALLLIKSSFWSMPQKIFMVIVMLPIIFVIVKIMANR